jgi:glutamate racemase
VFVEDILQGLVGPHVSLISTGAAVARQAHRLSVNALADGQIDIVLNNESAIKDQTANAIQLWTTGSLGALQHAADRWLNLPAHNCHWIAPSAL